MNVPDQLHGAMIRQAIEQARFEAGLRQRVLNLLRSLQASLVQELGAAGLDTPRTDWQQARLRKMLERANEKIAMVYGQVERMTSDQLAGLVDVTSGRLVAGLNQAVGADLLQPINWTEAQLKTLVDETLVFGAPSKEWWSRQSADLQQAFADQMRQGVIRGETVDQMVSRVRGADGLMEISRRNAEAMVRTSAVTMANEATLQTYGENADIIKGIQWVATLDTRTTPICRALDGRMWNLDYQPIEGNDLPFPGPVAHWNCRSTQVPVLRSWEELARAAGGDSALGAQLDAMDESTRASMDGPVSGNLTYEKWFEQQSPAMQKDILGERRWELWKKDGLSFRDMVDMRGRPLTLDELRAL